MNRADLLGKIAESAGITKAAAENAPGWVPDASERALKSGERVSVTGFGTFSVVQREEREGRNPATGKKIRIPAKKVVKFKPGGKLADQVQK